MIASISFMKITHMFIIGIYFLSSIPLLKNKILTFFLHLPQKSAYNILLMSKKSNKK